MEKIEEIYDHVYSIVIKAGQVMRDGYYGQKSVSMKTAFYDMVTEYDKQIEDLLINGILTKYPNHKFIGEEESSARKTDAVLTEEPTWIIDPIDGTTNFIKKIPHSCISIALALKKEIVIGIVFNPTSNELFTAKKGQGAFMNGEKIHVSDCDKVRFLLEISTIVECRKKFNEHFVIEYGMLSLLNFWLCNSKDLR